jgi:hypothetical protein
VAERALRRKFPISWSLAIIAGILLSSIVVSLLRKPKLELEAPR